MMNPIAVWLLMLESKMWPIRVTFTVVSTTLKKSTMMHLLTLSMASEMFILNDTAKNDPAVQLALQAYTERLNQDYLYQQQVRAGLITPQPTQVWNISDRD